MRYFTQFARLKSVRRVYTNMVYRVRCVYEIGVADIFDRRCLKGIQLQCMYTRSCSPRAKNGMPLGGVGAGEERGGGATFVPPLPENVLPEFVKSCGGCGLPKQGVKIKRSSFPFVVGRRPGVYLSGRVCAILAPSEKYANIANTTPKIVYNVSTAV